VTPADKSGSTGQNTERDSDRTSTVATDGQATPVDGAVGGDHGADHHAGPATNGKADEPTSRVAKPDDAELNPGTPPPWQRVTGEESSDDTSAPATPTTSPASQQSTPQSQKTTPVATPSTPPRTDSGPNNPPPSGEKTVSIERPVVTGAAAARLFGDGLPTAAPAPGTGMPHGGATPSRTTVHLEGSGPSTGGPSTGPLRIGAAATPSALRRPGRGPRRANLQIKRFDPWSVLKLSLVLGVALFFVWLVAVGVLYAVLDGMGVWDKLNGISNEILQPTDNGGGQPLISAGRVFGVAAIIGAVNIVLFSALSTVGAFIYNVSADLAGGLEVTLAERE
jgi:hypothetical protein